MRNLQKSTLVEREERMRNEQEGLDAFEGREAKRKTAQGKLVI